MNGLCAKLRVQYDLLYCNVPNNNTRSHIQSLTTYFCQYCKQLSCYLTRTFWARAFLAGFQDYSSRTDPFSKRLTSLYASKKESIRRDTCWNFLCKAPNSVTSEQCHVLVPILCGLRMKRLGSWPPFWRQNSWIFWLRLSHRSHVIEA